MKLILIHGAGGTPASLAPLEAALGPDVDLIVPALPGRPPTGGTPLSSVAELGRWVMSRVPDDERIVVAGHSLGGAVALTCALDFPQRVAALALFATGARLRVHPAILAALDGALGGAAAGAASALATLPPGLCSAEVPLATALCDWHAADRFDAMARLPDVRAATVIMSGEADTLTPPKYARYLAAHIPRSELVLLAGASHFLPSERPLELAALLRRLIVDAASSSP